MNKRLAKKKKVKSFSAKEIKQVINDEDNEEVKLDYGDLLSGDKVISTDRDVESKVILHTFINEDKLEKPEEKDLFVAHSLELAENEPDFIPWVSGDFDSMKDEIEDAIKNTNQNGLKDSIESSGIINLNIKDNKPSKKLEVY